MIGSDLNLDLPTLGESIATLVSKTAAALSAIEVSIADKATPAALNINAPLDMAGNAITEVTSVQFAAGNLPSVAGSIYYSEGDWYVIDSVGTIKLTDNGALNAAGVAGIAGDYGGVNPAAVSYDDASGEYRFTEAPGTYADLVAHDVVLNGSAGTVRITVNAAIATARVIDVKSLPAAGVSLLAYDPADSTLVDASTVTIDNALTVTDITATEYHHTGEHRRFGMAPAVLLTNCGLTNETGAQKLTSTGASWEWAGPAIPLRLGDRVVAFDIHVSTALAGNITVNLMTYDNVTGAASIDEYVFDPGTTAGTYSRTVAVPATITSTNYNYFRVRGATSGVSIRSILATYTHP